MDQYKDNTVFARGKQWFYLCANGITVKGPYDDEQECRKLRRLEEEKE